MKSVLMLMVSLTQVQLSLSCPTSCVVCSEDAVICNKLSSFVEAPNSTKALILTDGLIETVDSIVFCGLSNMSLLVLSNNVIFTIMSNAFQNLTVLRTLLLDHNRITTPSLDRYTFSWLSKLETLQLGNNALRDIDGAWFQNTKALKTLFLEGNLLTSLNSSTFASSDLRNLETLGLSDNLITYVGQDSFHNLPRLRSLDLSRNRLQNAPDAFSYLSWLSLLNLDLNRWNCTCELRELASFLNSYIQSPGKVLYNGQRMVCESSDNKAVRTVLEITESNCALANRNISVLVAKGSITPQRYIRDVTITAACSFLSGVGIMIGVLAFVYRRLSKKFALCQAKKETKGESTEASAQWNYSEDKGALSTCYSLHNSNYRDHQPCNKDASYDVPPSTVNNQFICHNCSSANLKTSYQEGRWRKGSLLQRSNQMGIQHNRKDDWSSHANSGQWKGTTIQSRLKDVRLQTLTEKDDSHTYHFQTKRNDPQNGLSQDLSTIRIQQSALRRQISVAQRQTFTPNKQMHNNMDVPENCVNNQLVFKHQLKEYSTLPVFQTINCLRCDETYEYRQTGSKDQDILFRNHKEGMLPRGDSMPEAILYKNPINYNLGRQGGGQARAQRTVTFALSEPMDNILIVPSKKPERNYRVNSTKTSKKQQQKGHPRQGKAFSKVKRSSTRRQCKSHKPKSPLNRILKVKLNLNPLRKSQVYPKSSSSHEDYDKDTVRKGKLAKSKVKKDGNSQLKSKKGKTTKKSTHNGNKLKRPDSSKQSQENNQGSTFISENNSDNNKENSNDHCETAGNETTFPKCANIATTGEESASQQDGGDLSNDSTTPKTSGPTVVQEYLSSGDGSPKRRIRLIIPEKTSSRPQTALERKIR